ncbi:hypothetical protein HPB48_007997 [Haemaphysalis longicornis]|uniref:Uncharacterized protein n=1 Tax=Haemaphysalis longicornis TaxID=44386 RepID=A0A9J6GY93_HAELO|nr:hypothetical protein HPB48_007997 [Haemaphysalis longicornis]
MLRRNSASDVCTHLESRCDSSRVPRAAAVQPGTVPQEQESLGATCSEISDVFRQRDNANSITMSSIQAELKEISRTLKNGVLARSSSEEEADERNLERRLLQESLNQMRIQTAKLKDQLDEFVQNVYANQQTFHNSFVEKNEALKQSLTDAVQSRLDHCELATQFVAFGEAMGEGQRETKGGFDRLALAIDRQYDRMSELLRSTDASHETRTRNSAEAAEALTERLAQDASKIAWAKNSTPEDRQNAVWALLTSIMPAATTHTWTFEDFASLKQRAQSEFLVKRMGSRCTCAATSCLSASWLLISEPSQLFM